VLDPDVERAAQFLAAHALLLLGMGLLAAGTSVAVIVWAAHPAERFAPVARRMSRPSSIAYAP
jgi:hypothetical protein